MERSTNISNLKNDTATVLPWWSVAPIGTGEGLWWHRNGHRIEAVDSPVSVMKGKYTHG